MSKRIEKLHNRRDMYENKFNGAAVRKLYEHVGQGRDPDTLAAALRYVQDDSMTMKEAADEFDTSFLSVMQYKETAEDVLGKDAQRGRSVPTKMMLVGEDMADKFGLVEGEDFTRMGNGQPYLRKAGLQKIVGEG